MLITGLAAESNWAATIFISGFLKFFKRLCCARFMASPQSANLSAPGALGYSMPAEWEPHAATWLAWPHNASDWPGKFEIIPWIYGEMIRKISAGENIQLIVRHNKDKQFARHVLKSVGADSRKSNLSFTPQIAAGRATPAPFS